MPPIRPTSHSEGSRRKLLPIVVDTREQLPFQFDPARTSTVRRALPAGDYSLEGFETRAAIERKSLDDFVSTVIHARFRFEEELLSLATYELGCVVVEASIQDVLDRRYRAGVHPNAVMGAAIAIYVDHRVPVFFAGDRLLACRLVEGLLARFFKRASA
jgi:DNA excision repair protein ERCC-4